MLLSNNFDGGTAGSVITVANSSGVSGTAWTSVTGSPTYTATGGSGAPLCATVARSSTDQMGWDIAPSGRDVWVRLYLQLTGTPQAEDYILSSEMQLSVTTSRTLSLRKTSGAQVNLSTVIPTGQWVRIELYSHTGTTTSDGAAELRLYLSPDSTTATDSGAVSSVNTGTTVPTSLGIYYSSGMTTYLLDSVAVTDTTWLGPATAVTPARAPVMVPYAPQRASRW